MTVSGRIARQLTAARDLLTAVFAHADIQAILANYGYDLDRLQEGQALYEAALAQQQQEQDERSKRIAAQHAYTAAWARAGADYTYAISLARVVFRTNHAVIARLSLKGPRNRGYASWLLQARQFYTGALGDPAILQSLNGCGITQAGLEEGLRLLDALVACRADYLACLRAARTITSRRRQALYALELWLSDFRVIVRRVLRNRPEYLDRLGLGAHTKKSVQARGPTATGSNDLPTGPMDSGQAARMSSARNGRAHGTRALSEQELVDQALVPTAV